MAATEPIQFKSFAGLRNDVPSERLPIDALSTATNIDLDDTGAPSRRDGFVGHIAGTDVHSLWSDGPFCFNVNGSGLYRVNDDLTSTAVVSGLTPGMPMHYARIGDIVYFSNGLESGAYEGGYRPWGITPPADPTLSIGTGLLTPGTYLVALTYRTASGRESGAGAGSSITLEAQGGINVYLPRSVNPTVTEVVVYMTTPDGGTLYEAAVVPSPTGPGVTITLVGPQDDLHQPLMTQFYGLPPTGAHLALHRGRLYMADGNSLHYSAAYGYELFKQGDHIGFRDRITMVAPCDAGIFVGAAGKTWWLAGTKPEEMVQPQAAAAEPIPGSLVWVDGGRVTDLQVEQLLPMWLSADGVTVGLPDGSIRVMGSEYRFTPPARAAGMFRKVGETFQYVASFMGD